MGGALIFGGTCSSDSGVSNVCLTRYYAGVLQPLFLKETYMGPDDYSVNAITYNNGSDVIIGGNFYVGAMIGSSGNNLASYNLVSNWIEPMAIFDAPVNGLAYMSNTLYIGGEFTANMSNSLNHMGRVISTIGIDESELGNALEIYPNPFKNIVHVKGSVDGTPFSIVNASGQVVNTGELQDLSITGLENLPSGVYLLRLETENGVKVHRIMK